jgi:ATP-binding cassette, subfamily B, bacterial HlyB/CyaB
MDAKQKLAALQKVGPFSLLEEKDRAKLAAHAAVLTLAFGETVFKTGDAGDAMYVVVSGKARIVGENASGEEVSLALLQESEFFGITALLSDSPRTATVRAADELILLKLSRADFNKVVARNSKVLEPLRRYVDSMGIQNFLRQFTALETLPPHVLRTLVTELDERSLRRGEVVVREGEVGDRFFIVRSGSLEAIKEDGRIVGQMGPGEFFGELSLLTGAPRAASVVARSDCQLYAMSKAGFDRALAASPEFRRRLEERASLYRTEASGQTGVVRETKIEREPVEGEPEPKEGEYKPKGWFRWLKRYPYVAQHDETDCGAACLAMITAHYGVPVGVARLRDMANVDADGANMWSVAQAAESLGFHARGLQLSYDALRDIQKPCIIHWQGFHYIVCYEANERDVLLGDPGIALHRMPLEEFRQGWTGRALELVPTAKLGKTEPIKSPFHRFWPIVKPHGGLLTEVLFASLLLSVLGLGIPLFTQMVLDRVLVTRSVDLLNYMMIGMVGIALFQGILTAVRRFLLVHVSTRASAQLTSDFLRHVLELPMKFFDLRRVGDVISRVQENEKVRAALVSTIPGVVLDTVLALGYVGLMAYYNLKLTAVVLAVVPLFVVLMLAFTPAIRRNRKEHFAKHADAWSTMIESFTGIGTVKSTAVEQTIRWRMENLFVESLVVGRKGAHLEAVYSTLATFLQTVSSVLFLWYGAQQVMANSMTVGQLLAFTSMAASVIGPILRLVEAWDDLQDVRNALERLNDVFDAKPEEEPGRALLTLDRLQGRIQFEKVTFKYSGGQDKPTLAGINLEIRAGETVAVVGRSGSGKSTLAKLILGLYPPTKGKLLIDGHDLRALNRRALRRRIGVVPQEVFLFSGTVRENIALGDPDIPFDRIVAAAKMAGAHEFISAMGMGYDTKVGERGMSMSGGQRQRVALARALLRNPDVLVLDEATSALDNESERSIQHNLQEASKGRTTIVIAHRLSTVQNADRILVLDGGSIVEQGKHDELVEKGGLYATLVGGQVEE